MVVDAHCHVSTKWYEPAEALLFQMDRSRVERACLVQMLGEFDNSYQSACVRRHPDRLASIVGVDAARPDAGGALLRAIDDGARGIRLSAASASADGAARDLWTIAGQSRLPVSCSGPASAFLAPAFIAMIENTPDLVVVLEHLGGLARPDYDGAAETRRGLLGLFRFPNVCLKIPGLGQLQRDRPIVSTDGRTATAAGIALLTDVIDRYPAERLMWGSDFPPVSSREGYANALDWTRHALAYLPLDRREAIFGGSAQRLFFARDW